MVTTIPKGVYTMKDRMSIELIKPLLEVWRYSGYISSKHLVTFIRLNEDKLSSLLERLTPDVRE